MGALRNFTVLLGSALIMSTSCSSDNGDEVIFVDRPETFSETEEKHTLTVAIIPEGGGSVSPSYGTFEDGDELTLIARPSPGYSFNGWTGSVVTRQQDIEIIMDSDKYMVALFTPVPRWDDTR